MSIEYTSQVHTRSGIITSAGTVLPEYTSRRTAIVQNLNGTHPLFVKFGSGASSTDFDFILKAGSDPDDGNGGTFAEDTLSYTGIISVAGTTVRCTATDF